MIGHSETTSYTSRRAGRPLALSGGTPLMKKPTNYFGVGCMHTISELTRSIYQTVPAASALLSSRGAQSDSWSAPAHSCHVGASQPDLACDRQQPFVPIPPASSLSAFTGEAHGKVILLGEHAVVYGAPAVALAVPTATCRATALLGDRPGRGLTSLCVRTPDPGGRYTELTASPSMHALVATALERADRTQATSVDLLLESNIPPGRGLGSSAASARAVAASLNHLLDLRLGPQDLFDLVQSAERLTHGRSSGIDAHATGQSGLVVLNQGRMAVPVTARQGWVVVADSGTSGSTHQAVEMLNGLFTHSPFLQRDFLGRSTVLTADGLDALAAGQLERLGHRLTETHTLLTELGLVTAKVHGLVDTALSGGALGAKMTGGGLGGCAIALAGSRAQADELAAHLRAHGATRTWLAPLLAEGCDQ
ncbi:mevalonate kinase [Streptomyces cyaneofuscatus]|uniref:mevalonate kinase n=1 Tax=Streptomyces cyaneofuscatus TaxID=66883 RepID=UPI00365D4735